MKYFFIILLTFFSLNFYGKNLTKQDKIYLYALSLEGANSESLKNYNGFISNVTIFLKNFDRLDYCNLEPLVGTIHNILIETFYHCDAKASRATNFNEAVSGKNTPDSLHYAVLMHDALILRGIYTKFFSINNLFYGISVPCKTKSFYWSILNPVIGHTTWSQNNLLRTYIKYQNLKIDSNALSTTDKNIKELSKDQLVKILENSKIKTLPHLKSNQNQNKDTYNIKKKYKVINKEKTNDSMLLSKKFVFHKLNNEPIDTNRISKNINDKFYTQKILKKIEACVDREKANKRWLKLSYIILSNGKIKNINLLNGKKDTSHLVNCFKTVISKLTYISIDSDIKVSHYLYFKD